jgi:hypothetical protein
MSFYAAHRLVRITVAVPARIQKGFKRDPGSQLMPPKKKVGKEPQEQRAR